MSFTLEDYLYGFLKHYYNSSPQALKSVAGRVYRALPDSLRYGKTYTHYLSLLEKSQWWSKREIEEYQWNQTKRLLQHAYNNVIYYRNLFDERGLDIKDIQNFHDFKSIPFLTKDIIRDNLNDLLAKNFKESNLIPVTTGGSTGTPLPLFYEKGVSRPMDYAFMLHQWGRAGYRVGDKMAVLRGDVIKGSDQSVPSYFDPIRNRLVLSSFHMAEENIPKYIEKLISFRPKFLHVYPSSLTVLAQNMKENQLDRIPTLQAILASSETIHQWQLDLFREIFQCNVFYWYGLIELAALASVCEFSSYYHVFPEYSYVEFLRDDDDFPDTKNDEIHEIVGTSFCNNAMPLIRYRTMDYAVPNNDTCKCGRNYLLMEKVLGRKQEFLVDRSGCWVTFTCADEPLWPVKHKINAYQYIQKEPGIVVLNIETKHNLNTEDLKTILKEFRKRYTRFTIDIQLVDSILRTPRGKFFYLIQNCPKKTPPSAESVF